jgi:Ca2+-binding RTX toxin-like protein
MADNVIFNGRERQLNFNSGGLDGVTNDQFDVAVTALTGGGYVVAYESDNGANDDIYYQRLDANGQPIGTTLGVKVAGNQESVSLAGRADGGFVGVYENRVTVSGNNFHQLVLEDFTAAGGHVISALDSSVSANTPAFSFFLPDVDRLASGRFLAVYETRNNATGDFDVKFNTYDPTTGNAGTAAFLTTSATVHEFDAEVAASTVGNTALAVYTEENNATGNNVKARLFDATTGTFSTTTLTVADSPVIDTDDADVAALTDGRYVIVWQEGDTLVRGRIFDPATGSFGPTFLVNGTAGDQNDPRVAALPGGRFMVAWEEGATFGGDVETNAIVARRFNAAGAADGDAFLVNTSKADDQGNPAIASRPDGSFQIVWEDHSQQNTTDQDEYGVKGQHFRLPDTAGARGDTNNGTAGDDFLSGYPLHETFNGFGGNDVIVAGGGNDTVNGGAGLDLIRGGNGNDILNGGGGGDPIFGEAGNDILRGGTGNDRLDGGSGNDQLFGEAGHDILLGGAGNDRLDGGAGDDRLEGGVNNDVLTGGRGRDLLIGGAGRDTFDFNFVSESRRGVQHDTAVFSHSQGDKIDLRTIDADTDGTAGNQGFHFIGASGFSGHDGELRFAGGLLQGDVNGDKIADLEIRVVGTLVGADILL